MFLKRIIVRNWERFLIARNGRFHAILAPGKHRIFTMPGMTLEIEKHDARNFVFESAWANYLVRERPDVLERHFIRVEANEVQVGMVYLDGELFKVLAPGERVFFWRGQADVRAELVDVIGERDISSSGICVLEQAGARLHGDPFE